MRKKWLYGCMTAVLMFSSLCPVRAEEAVTEEEAVVAEQESIEDAEEETPAETPSEGETPVSEDTQQEDEETSLAEEETPSETETPDKAIPCITTELSVVLPGEEIHGTVSSYALSDGRTLYGFSSSLPLEDGGEVIGTLDLSADAFLLVDGGSPYLLTAGAYDIMEGLFEKNGKDYMDALAIQTDYIALPSPEGNKESGLRKADLLHSLAFLIPENEGEYTAEGEEVFTILSEENFSLAGTAIQAYLSSYSFDPISSAVDQIASQAGADTASVPVLSWIKDPAGSFLAFWNADEREEGYGRKLAAMFREPYDNGADVSLHGWRNTDGCGVEYTVTAPVNTEGIGAYSIRFARTYGESEIEYPEYSGEAEKLTDVTGRFFYILDAGKAAVKAAEDEEPTEPETPAPEE